MSSQRLQRTYVLRGLDRILYASMPQWKEGTFEQALEDEGRLVLVQEEITSVLALRAVIQQMDRQAERFRLAISRRTGCSLTLKLEGSDEPSFDPPGQVTARSGLVIGDAVEVTLTRAPTPPPVEMEQLPEGAARWVQTLAELKNFSNHPDEIAKRLYLLIEELLPAYGGVLDTEQKRGAEEARLIRNFVSHPVCDSSQVCEFVAAELPSAVISTKPMAVQFDRTQVEHANFIGRHEPMTYEIARRLVDAAIEAASIEEAKEQAPSASPQ